MDEFGHINPVSVFANDNHYAVVFRNADVGGLVEVVFGGRLVPLLVLLVTAFKGGGVQNLRCKVVDRIAQAADEVVLSPALRKISAGCTLGTVDNLVPKDGMLGNLVSLICAGVRSDLFARSPNHSVGHIAWSLLACSGSK